MRNGLYLGDLKKNRFEPSQPLALALHKGDVKATISLSLDDQRITRYLKGETLNIEPEEAVHKKGYCIISGNFAYTEYKEKKRTDGKYFRIVEVFPRAPKGTAKIFEEIKRCNKLKGC